MYDFEKPSNLHLIILLVSFFLLLLLILAEDRTKLKKAFQLNGAASAAANPLFSGMILCCVPAVTAIRNEKI